MFVWTIRTTTKLFNGTYTPYEVITGLKPRSPIEPLLATGNSVTKQSVDDYVERLCEYLKRVHKQVDQEHTRIREDSQRAKLRTLPMGGHLAVGDYVMVRKEPEKGVSERLQSRTFDAVFQVVEAHGGLSAKAYTVSDLSGNRENLGFKQPVAQDRLLPIDMLPLTHEDGDQRTKLVVDLLALLHRLWMARFTSSTMMMKLNTILTLRA